MEVGLRSRDRLPRQDRGAGELLFLAAVVDRNPVELGGVVDKVPLEQISKKIVEHL